MIKYFPDLHRASDTIEFVEPLVHPPAHGDFIADILVYPSFMPEDDWCGIPDDILDKIKILLFAKHLGYIGRATQIQEHENVFFALRTEVPAHKETAKVARAILVIDH